MQWVVRRRSRDSEIRRRTATYLIMAGYLVTAVPERLRISSLAVHRA
jgi:hypothetical protein